MITFATAITLMRMVLTPAVVASILRAHFGLASMLFLVAAATDLLDGWVARRYNQQSRLGQLLDPVADKILIMSTFFALLRVVDGLTYVQRAAVTALIAKELILLLGAAILLVRRDIFLVPTRLSRLASLSECLAIVVMLGCAALTGAIPSTLVTIILVSSLATSAWLLLRYGRMIIFGRMRT